MLYTASYFEPENHHGELISISRTVPNGVRVDSELPLFAPSPDLLRRWKAKLIDEDGYTSIYREQMRKSWSEVKNWVSSVHEHYTATLLCWEKAGEFCHRNFVAVIIEAQRPEIFGGRDVRRSICGKCETCTHELIPGLDASWCPKCRICYEDIEIMAQYREELRRKDRERETREIPGDNEALPLPGL